MLRLRLVAILILVSAFCSLGCSHILVQQKNPSNNLMEPVKCDPGTKQVLDGKEHVCMSVNAYTHCYEDCALYFVASSCSGYYCREQSKCVAWAVRCDLELVSQSPKEPALSTPDQSKVKKAVGKCCVEKGCKCTNALFFWKRL